MSELDNEEFVPVLFEGKTEPVLLPRSLVECLTAARNQRLMEDLPLEKAN